MDTYTGCRNWGWPRFVCLLAAVVINGGLAYPTSPSWIPDPFFRIYLGRVHRDKHGSDSLSYDNQGRFRPQAFEEFFANYDREGKGGLSIWDLGNAWVGQVSFCVFTFCVFPPAPFPHLRWCVCSFVCLGNFLVVFFSRADSFLPSTFSTGFSKTHSATCSTCSASRPFSSSGWLRTASCGPPTGC